MNLGNFDRLYEIM